MAGSGWRAAWKSVIRLRGEGMGEGEGD